MAANERCADDSREKYIKRYRMVIFDILAIDHHYW